jgi:hypothetical protein
MDYSEGEWWEVVVIRPPFPVTDNLASADGRVTFVEGFAFRVVINSQNVCCTCALLFRSVNSTSQ